MNLITFLTSGLQCLTRVKRRNRALGVLVFALLQGAYSIPGFAQQQGDFIPLPQYTTLDALGVNVSGNTVAPTVATLAIGGELGLSHSITLQGNIFSIDYSEHGFRDKFAGGIRYTYLGKNRLSNDAWVLTASAMDDSVQFVEMCNGKFTGDLPANSCSPTYFEAAKDKRHTLQLKDNQDGQGPQVVWTKPDGTEVYFNSASLSRSTNGNFKKIIYPNGFTINVDFFTVTTNTGYELKYNYELDNRGIDSSKSGIIYNNSYPRVSSTWWMVNPKSITAINNAYEYCANQQAPCTNLTKSWPTTTFDWPGGMPRTFFMGNSVFRVTNPVGTVAEYNYQAQDANKTEGGTFIGPENTNVAPRLVSIKPFGASQPAVSYTYKNTIHIMGTPDGSAGYTVPGDPGILTRATGIAGTSNYSVYDLEGYHGKGYSGYRLGVDMNEQIYSRLEKVYGNGRTIIFDQFSFADQITDDQLVGGSSKKYTYTNNNVQTVTDQATGTTEAGGYPESCINPTLDRNRKTCNKPAWVKNNGAETDYTYHHLSGQVETVTLPADKNGKRAQTRYEYTPLQASYLSATGTTTGSPIYLKTAEKYCMNSNFNGAGDGNSVFTGACELGANDEVVTRYEYDAANNLRLKGKTVTAVNTAGVPTVKRTCYQYDIYNNVIGEIQPNANLASCD